MVRRVTLFGTIAVALLAMSAPAQAVHFFHGCPNDVLEPAPATASAGQVAVGVATGVDVNAPLFADQLTAPLYLDATTRGPVTVIEAGDSITWTFADGYCHSITALSDTDQEVFGFAALAEPVGNDTTYTATFTQAGEYTYFCVHHATIGMVGEIVVVPTTAAPQA